MRYLWKYTIAFLFLMTLYSSCKSSDPLVKKQTIEELDNKVIASRYTFTAKQALPMSGRNVNLSPDYTLKVSPDTIQAYLPYYGRAYSAPTPFDEGGIKFVSTDFDYQLADKEKGIYRVAINIKDNPNNYKLSILIGENGSGTVHINQNTKQSISFQGVIE